MAKNEGVFPIPKTLLAELKNAAKEKGQSLSGYMDDFLIAVLCVNWDQV
jgi:hypothetical protein